MKTIFYLIALTTTSIFFFSCSTLSKPYPQRTGGIIGDDYSLDYDEDSYNFINTYFGTNRKPKYTDKLEFSSERDSINYGNCYVSIPARHELGNIERPTFLGIDFSSLENPYRHIVVWEKEIIDSRDFTEISIGTGMPNDILLFIHGYNVSFDQAARRTAQLSYDLGFKGIPMFFSWPSNGKIASYLQDSQNIEYSELHLFKFLEKLLLDFPEYTINIIGHSMGTRGLTNALIKVKEKHPTKTDLIKEIILAAPDIDADVFKTQIAPEIISFYNSITLYSSSKDKALKVSKKVNGSSRAGDSGKGLIVLDGIQTIDASNVDTGILSHSYFGDTPRLISDIEQIVKKGFDAEERSLLKVKYKDGIKFWKFK